MSTLTELAQSQAARAFQEVTAFDANAVERILELLFTERGFADESEVTEAADKASIVYNLAYRVVLSALDVTRSKLKKGQATPAAAEFRDMVKDFEALLKRLARIAGIEEEAGQIEEPKTFIIDKVPFFEET